MIDKTLTPEEINNLYNEYIDELSIKEKNIKLPTHYEVDNQLTDILSLLKDKEIIL